MAPFLLRDYELAAKIESAYGTDPTIAAADFFKHTTQLAFERVQSRYDRDQDRDKDQADVITTHRGRESSTWKMGCDLIPSGAAITPTPPDVDPFMVGMFGNSHTGSAHTTTDTGSTGVTLNLTTGGGAASGIPTGGGVLIACDVSSVVGVEVRFVVSRAGDVVTLDRAFTADPATGRAVYVGTTYQLTEANSKTLRIQEWLDGNNFRHAIPGAAVQNMTLDSNWAQDNPVAKLSFEGVGGAITTHSTSRPTPTTAGVPLIPTEGKVWVGSTLVRPVNIQLKMNNGLENRANTSASLVPTGVKRTANNSRYNHTQQLDLLLETGAIEGYFDNASSLTAYDVIVQLGVSVGSIVAWRTRKFIPDAKTQDTDGEVGLSLMGRCYGSSGDDSVYLAFI